MDSVRARAKRTADTAAANNASQGSARRSSLGGMRIKGLLALIDENGELRFRRTADGVSAPKALGACGKNVGDAHQVVALADKVVAPVEKGNLRTVLRQPGGANVDQDDELRVGVQRLLFHFLLHGVGVAVQLHQIIHINVAGGGSSMRVEIDLRL